MSVAKNDERAIEVIRGLGREELMTEDMVGLYTVRRAQGDTVLDALHTALLRSLSDCTIRDMAPKVQEAADEMARRGLQ